MYSMKFAIVTAVVAMTAKFAASQQSIAEIAQGTEALSTLVDLVVMADLLTAIDGSSGENITVFAPTNEAFGTLPQELVSNLMTPAWGAHLSSILKTHIVGSVIPSSAITEPASVTTLSGEMVNVTIDPIAIDGAVVSMPDVEASNGVVHVIDGVITPAWVDKTLPAAASEVSGVSTLVSLLTSAGLVEALTAEGPFTVFAPTNAAFEELGEATTKCVTENPEILTSVLLYHVLPLLVPAAEVATATVETLESSTVDINADALTVNSANIVGADALLANNGIAHLIDAVLVPSSVTPNITACLEMNMESGVKSWFTGFAALVASVSLTFLFI